MSGLSSTSSASPGILENLLLRGDIECCQQVQGFVNGWLDAQPGLGYGFEAGSADKGLEKAELQQLEQEEWKEGGGNRVQVLREVRTTPRLGASPYPAGRYRYLPYVAAFELMAMPYGWVPTGEEDGDGQKYKVGIRTGLNPHYETGFNPGSSYIVRRCRYTESGRPVWGTQKNPGYNLAQSRRGTPMHRRRKVSRLVVCPTTGRLKYELVKNGSFELGRNLGGGSSSSGGSGSGSGTPARPPPLPVHDDNGTPIDLDAERHPAGRTLFIGAEMAQAARRYGSKELNPRELRSTWVGMGLREERGGKDHESGDDLGSNVDSLVSPWGDKSESTGA